jgi:anaerobic selenocysteine-containing dehydrogenase
VVFASDGAIDAAATAARRASLAAQRCTLTVAAHAAAGGEYANGRRYVQLHPSAAARAGLADGAPIEIVVPVGAPLRAWVRLNEALADGAVWIGAEGAAMIGVAPGASVRLRALPLGNPTAQRAASPKALATGEAVSA